MLRKSNRYRAKLSGRTVSMLLKFPLGFGMALYGLSLARGESFSWSKLWQQMAATFLISWIIFGVVAAGITASYKVGMFAKHKPKTMQQLTFIGALAVIGLSLGLVMAGYVLEYCCQVPFVWDRSYFVGSIFTGTLVTVAIVFYHAFHSGRRRILELERATVSSKYETLKAQLQPHFLFNSLNSLSELIDARMPEASLMTSRLADLYRHILENSKEKTTTLASELTIIQDYLELEKLRFGHRLSFSIQSDVSNDSIYIPSLILQTLVENAVKHGISPSIDGGHVSVKATLSPNKWVAIEIKNSGLPLQFAKEHLTGRSTGTGLSNAKERLTLMYGEKHEFFIGKDEDGDTVVRFCVSGERFE